MIVQATSATRRCAAALLAIVLGLSAGCSACKSPDAAADAAAASPAPVPAPAGLIAEAFLPTPDATWAKARALAGGPAALLPSSVGALAASLLGLPIAVASEIDGSVPVLGAAVEAPDRPRPRAAIGLHVKDGARFVDQLTRGEGARFRAKPDAATSIALLEPLQAPAPGTTPVALGVLGNYLLVAESADDLTLLGPYVARTMPQAAAPKEDLAIEIPRAAIEGPVLKAARSAWEKARGGEGAPRASAVPLAPMIEGGLAVLGDLERARLTLVLDDGAHLRASGTPKAGGGPASKASAELAVGDVKPLLDLPADTVAGILVRDRAASRAEDVPKLVDAVAGLVEGELSPADRERLSAALRAASDARGDWFVGGLRFEATGPTAYVRAAVGDRVKLEGALADLLGSAELAPIKSSLQREGLRVSSSKAELPQLAGDVRRLRIEQLAGAGQPGGAASSPARTGPGGAGLPGKGGGPGAPPPAIELLYLVRDDGLFASVGNDPGAGLRSVVGALQGETLGGVPTTKAALAPLGSDIAFALVLEPLRFVASRLGQPGGGDPAPVVIAAGATPADGGAPAALWARADVASAALREIIRLGGGF
ncbi:hypothetical protein SOCE26_011730 [Sorangium cellulosum]|uniref:Secreted protein n=1 Tax=Sorangium cellulosum TaxID=56 RepID=A0A2L0EKH8_SORCE|nr:hypothetical protein [Sorangium cellulosum]AUX39778.1 hypothetical protein SOCE26_011730 [Sorangium cellulosum]